MPDIPSEQGAIVNWEPTGDNSSEHYATVGQYQNAGIFLIKLLFFSNINPVCSILVL